MLETPEISSPSLSTGEKVKPSSNVALRKNVRRDKSNHPVALVIGREKGSRREKGIRCLGRAALELANVMNKRRKPGEENDRQDAGGKSPTWRTAKKDQFKKSRHARN